MRVGMLVALLVLCGCRAFGLCLDPGLATFGCEQMWTEDGVMHFETYWEAEMSCADYAEEGDQSYGVTVDGCHHDVSVHPDGVCLCTRDVSACSFPCGKND